MLNVNTPRGLVAVAEEQKAADLYQRHFLSVMYAQTPKGSPSLVDGVLIRDKKIIAVFETKCRFNCTLDQFRKSFKNEWLVTYDKIVKGRDIAKMLYVRFIGFVWLVDSKCLLVQTLWDPALDNSDKPWMCDVRVQRTRTKAGINGGIADRDNAFVDMSGCTILTENEDEVHNYYEHAQWAAGH